MPTVVVLWDLASGREVRRLEAVPGWVSALAFSPERRQVAATVYPTQRLVVWDMATGRLAFERKLATLPTGLAWSPRGDRLATAGFDNRVVLWDARSGREVLTLESLGPSGNGDYNFTAWVTFSPAGTRLAATDWSGHVTIWDAGQSPARRFPR